MPPTWTLDNARPIVRAIDAVAKRCNFSLALRGSVLTRGESDSDLDLCFLCEEPEDPAFCSVERLLREITQELSEQVDRCNPSSGGTNPHTLIFLRDGRRIDAHFWL
jgi:hypothetical protein